jgi:chitinase
MRKLCPLSLCPIVPILLTALSIQPISAAPPKNPHQIVAYVFPQQTILQPGQIDPHLITRINFAFANIQGGRMVLGHPEDAANLAFLTSLRHDNPNLTILISVGGWLWSGGFTDAVLTEQSRQTFLQSALDFLRQYHLDGLDIDWEYPGLPGADHPFRPEDGKNFNILLKELRAAFDRESSHGSRLYLTIAAGASDDFLQHTQMAVAQRYLDTVNLMAYDYYEPGSGPITGHHAPLFTNPADPIHVSADASVRAFEKAGVPASKLVLGVPFYGHLWGEVPDQNHGLYQPGKPIPNTYAPFSQIESSMLNQGFTRYWDATSNVPWLYNPQTRTFVSYEDPQSLTEKCRYIRTNKLAGIMFWHYANDDANNTLLKTINSGLPSADSPAGRR